MTRKNSHRHSVIALTALLLMGFASVIQAASVPALLLLEYAEAGKRVQIRIEAKPGRVTSPAQGKPQAQWLLRTGDALKANAQPPDRVVGFYPSADAQSPIFIVNVRYFRTAQGLWEPRFQINEEPLVARINDHWVPLTNGQGIPGLIVQTSNTLPNAEGYFDSIQFGFTTGAAPIGAWSVQ
jgi:hypothetical protein